MATFEIISKDYAKNITSEVSDDGSFVQVEGDYLKNAQGGYVKTVLQVKFIKDDESESEVQRYEVDGDDDEIIESLLQSSADEYNLRIN